MVFIFEYLLMTKGIVAKFGSLAREYMLTSHKKRKCLTKPHFNFSGVRIRHFRESFVLCVEFHVLVPDPHSIKVLKC